MKTVSPFSATVDRILSLVEKKSFKELSPFVEKPTQLSDQNRKGILPIISLYAYTIKSFFGSKWQTKG